MGGMGMGWRAALVGLGLVGLGGCVRSQGAPPARPDPRAVQTGYTTEDPSLETGAVTTIRAVGTDRLRFQNMQQFLQGRVAGLEVVPTGGVGYALRLRGTTSLNMSTEPLVVIDGVPVPPEMISNALAVVTPDQVRRVDVLKDAGSTAIWGIRGANGVIVITTFRGSDN